MNRSLRTGLPAALGMLLLILDARTALAGASEGINLCIMTVIPSLFPFFILSALLTGALSGLRSPLLRPLGRLCRVSGGAEPILLIGLLGGYPSGAQAVTQAYESGQLNARQARRMLGFCNNAGPAFIFGICGLYFPERWMAWALWGIHIVSALAVGRLLPGQPEIKEVSAVPTRVTLPQALDRAIRTVARVCGWVVLFRILIAFLNRWFLWLAGKPWQAFISGLLELTNGCCQLHSFGNPGLRFILCSAFLAFGGLCVAMQTASVTGRLGLGMYVKGKLLQCSISILLAAAVQLLFFRNAYKVTVHPLIFVLLLGIPTCVAIILRKYENKSSIPSEIGV